MTLSNPALRAERAAMKNDPIQRLSAAGRLEVIQARNYFEASVNAGALPSEGDRLALDRALSRFLIDSGVASARGYV